MSIKTLIQIWNSFFFKPISPLPISLFRITYGLLVVAFCISIAPNIFEFFGPNAILSLDTARNWYGPNRFSVFVVLAPSNTATVCIFGLLLTAAITLTLGYYTRLSAAIVFLLLVSFIHRNPAVFNGAETVMKLMAFYLSFSQAGAALSIDRWIRIQNGLEGAEIQFKAPWAQRLIQIQYAMIYLVTCLWKLRGSYWIDGTALYYAVHLAQYWRYPVPYVFEHLWTIKLMTWGTLLLEFALGTLLWIKELRYPILIAGALMHLGIEFTMVVPLFSWLMMIGYLTFVESQHLERCIYSLKQLLKKFTIAEKTRETA